MLYRVEYYSARNAHGEQTMVRSELCGTFRGAQLAATSYLKPHTVYATMYTWGRDLDRAPFCRVVALMPRSAWGMTTSGKARIGWSLQRRARHHAKHGKPISITPPVRIVPSVGELGYTP